MRLFNILLSLAQKVGAIDDYVVETGTIGDWSYKKWSSGTAEATTVIGAATTSSTGSEGGLFYRAIELNLPTGLFVERPRLYGTTFSDWLSGFVQSSTGGLETNRVYIWAAANNACADSSQVNVTAKGKWK